MTYGLDFAIPYVGDPDASLPWADDDDVMLVPGSLGLLELAHSASPVAGVPANNAVIPNIAWKRLKDLLGSGDATTLGFVRDGADIANVMVTERSSKGGLHGIVSQTNGTTANQGMRIRSATPLFDYIAANQTHDFYYSRWDRVTRIATSGNVHQAAFGSNTANYLALIQGASMFPSSGAALIGQTENPVSPNTLGNRLRAIAVANNTGSGAFAFADMACWGGRGMSASSVNQGASLIKYRSYLEDLTVSGRTYAQVYALDLALWTAAMGAGGRYADDTFTAPAI